jgi:hypothetical protein
VPSPTVCLTSTSDILCYNARGGIFSPGFSKSWQPLGPWELGLKDLSYGGNGDYGLEDVIFADTLHQKTSRVQSALIAAINDTDYYQGYIGVGVAQGRFGKNVTNPFITQLAEVYGLIPSHSYGYTAGANYGMSSNVQYALLPPRIGAEGLVD